MTSPTRSGYGSKLFSAWRYFSEGSKEERIENPSFILNQREFRNARILLAGENFGCGSSREPAVWAVRQFGIRCISAPSFGTIFQNNCVINGVLPALLHREAIECLSADAGKRHLTVDLEHCTVSIHHGPSFVFSIAAGHRKTLLRGQDAVTLTKNYASQISDFHRRDALLRPWASAPQ